MDRAEARRREEIRNEMLAIDDASLRSTRAILAAAAAGIQPDSADQVAVLDAMRQLYALRVELAGLDGIDPPPTPAALGDPVPEISKVQLVLWLLARGIAETDVESAIAAIPDVTTRAGALAEWKYRERFHADNPLVLMLAPQIGVEVDGLPAAFREAAGL